VIYLVDRDNMGQYNPDDDSQIVQSFHVADDGFWGTPAWWQKNIYVFAAGDVPKAFQLSGGLLPTEPTFEGDQVFFSGAAPAISCLGPVNGIVWAVDTSGSGDDGPAVLYAFDATDLSLLYTSEDAGIRDEAGPATRFTVPTVANGRVYVGSQTEISVYGPLTSQSGATPTLGVLSR
jgi:hypothetical protein